MHSTDRDIEGRESGDPTEFESCIDEEFFLRDLNFNGKAKKSSCLFGIVISSRCLLVATGMQNDS
jgi:hypothetical protein